MDLTDPPLPPETWAVTPCAVQALIVALQARIRDVEAQLGQTSANSSRPPSSDPPHIPPNRRGAPSDRKRGGQPGHRGAIRALLPVEQVDEMVAVVPERCRHCGEPFPATTLRGRARVWRPVVLWRKGSFGSDSEAGSRFAERLLTVVATCRQQGRSLLDFLVAAGEAALRGSPPPSLLPAPQGG